MVDTSVVPHPASPCVRNCCLDDRDVCVGCKRTLDEILVWSASSAVGKLEILENTQKRSLAALPLAKKNVP
ncbi:MAG: putative Fe-S protein YdhL (DUF1289 family) [Lentisphaeria bacterium]|jgi:predicted Fe-S protein YdhL (DUF1289 family)